MNVLTDAVIAVNDFFWSWLVIPLLIVLAVYFTVRSGFVQLRLFPEMFRVILSSPGTRPTEGRRSPPSRPSPSRPPPVWAPATSSAWPPRSSSADPVRCSGCG
ncbi:hypothetical protein [Nocardiopsis sp. CNR-923]|uniref:hypothetical protein n=1 Tax=Nocardiopsis sp. CNR-923 TaxID=1904965 RepID=UPI002915EB49|nr:hypothetical protein [Nocardiopsis sp. CNR-923]